MTEVTETPGEYLSRVTCNACQSGFVVYHSKPVFCIFCGKSLPGQSPDPQFGDEVEVKYQGGWFEAKVLSHNGASFLVRLEVGTLVLADEKKIRKIVAQDSSQVVVALPPKPEKKPATGGVAAKVAAMAEKQKGPPPVSKKPPSLPASPMPKKRPPVPTPPRAAKQEQSQPAPVKSSPPVKSAPGLSSPASMSPQNRSRSGSQSRSRSGSVSEGLPSPNMRRKEREGNSLQPNSTVKSLVKEINLLPSDSGCRFDLDDLSEDNCKGLKSVRIGFFGDSGVGKTNLIHAVVGNAFVDHPPTVFETLKWQMEIGAGWKTLPLELWDVSGQDRYAKKRPVIFPNVNAFVVCFDVNDHYSFENAKKLWLAEVASACGRQPVFLVGTKSEVGKAKVTQNEIDLVMKNSPVAMTTKLFFYVETSAKNLKFLDDLIVKCVYCALLDEKKLVQQKGGTAVSAAQKLAKLEEARRNKPPVPAKPGKERPSSPSSGHRRSPSDGRSSGADFVSSYGLAMSPPKSDIERQMDAMQVSAPTGFRHLKSAAEILREFDPSFAQKQKRPEAISIADAQKQLGRSSSSNLALHQIDKAVESEPPTSPKSPKSPTVLSPKLKKLLSPRSSQKKANKPAVPPAPVKKKEVLPVPPAKPEKVLSDEEDEGEVVVETPVMWTQTEPKFEPLNGTVFCLVVEDVASEREGDLSLSKGQVVWLNATQDFSEEWWFGAPQESPDEPGYFPQMSVVWTDQT